MSLPSKAIVPLVGRRNSDSTWNSVVFPAPFGPMTPWIVPACNARSYSLSAFRPRKDFDSPRTSRSDSKVLAGEGAGSFVVAGSCGVASLIRPSASSWDHAPARSSPRQSYATTGGGQGSGYRTREGGMTDLTGRVVLLKGGGGWGVGGGT